MTLSDEVIVMNSFARRWISVSTAALGATIYLFSAQPAVAEVDCTRPSKTKNEEFTCLARLKAGLEKSPPPGYRAPRLTASRQPRAPVARTWEEREKQARAFCDATGNVL